MSEKPGKSNILLAFTRGKEIVQVINWDSVLHIGAGTETLAGTGEEFKTIKVSSVGNGRGFWIGANDPQAVMASITEAFVNLAPHRSDEDKATVIKIDLGPI